MPTSLTKLQTAKALDALDGMSEIVSNEMLIRGRYVSENVDPDKQASGAICGGHKFCAVGSLWAGYGVKVERHRDSCGDPWFDLPGVAQDARAGFTEHRPALRAALDALNDSAKDYAVENGFFIEDGFHDTIEGLFEGSYAGETASGASGPSNQFTLTNYDLLNVIADARVRVAALERS